jgi:hypothetical protein
VEYVQGEKGREVGSRGEEKFVGGGEGMREFEERKGGREEGEIGRREDKEEKEE